MDERAEAVHQALRVLDARSARILTAVGGPSAVVRSVLFPKMSHQELTLSLAFEAEKYIPFKLEEVELDFSIRGDRPGGQMEVLLAAAPKKLVASHLDFLRKAELKIYAVDLEALALSNAWKVSRVAGESAHTLLVYVGARGSILNFFRDSELQFTREISIGGEAFTQALARGLQLDRVQAERLKCQPENRESEVRSVLEPEWENWLSQCRASFDFYENQFGHGVESVLLGGGCARLVGFRQWLHEATGLATAEWNPMAKFSVPSDSPRSEPVGAVLGVAVGLAVREAS